MKIVILLLCLVLAVAGCRDTPAANAASANLSGKGTPDSTRARELAEFRSGLAPVQELSGGVPSLDSLGRSVVTAMMANDRAQLATLRLTRGEFAWLYYPTNPQALPPYDLDPANMWLMLESGSGKGEGRAVGRLEGQKLTYQHLKCDEKPSVQGENRVYGPCEVRLTDAKGAVSEGRILAQVIERHGSWKVVSYANQLD